MSKKVNVKVINKSKHELPKYQTSLSAGMDLKANLDGNRIVLKPGERILIPTGLYIQLPEGYEVQIRPRSGLALKKGITVLNTPGTIDSDYTGEIGVILANQSDWEFVVNDGERIAQMVLNEVPQIVWNEVDSLENTERGDGGFGHTGVI